MSQGSVRRVTGGSDPRLGRLQTRRGTIGKAPSTRRARVGCAVPRTLCRCGSIILAMTVESATVHFQTCGACKRAWPTCDSFVLDPDVRLLGLQAVITNPDFNVMVFEHSCGSSVSILTPRLRHLLPEPEAGEKAVRLLGTEECRGHCRLLEDLEACDAPCSNARDRELILLIRRMKNAARSGYLELTS